MKENKLKEKITWFINEIKSGNRKVIISAAGIMAVIILAVVLFAINCTGREQKGTPDDKKSSQSETTKKTDKNEETTADNMAETTAEAENNGETTTGESNTDNQDPQEQLNNQNTPGAAVDMEQFLSENANMSADKAIGIDVSRYQGQINWSEVAASGIEFAMVRVGYRTTVSGEICEDAYAAYNIVNALSNNINVGVYFFSAAVSQEEAREEAEWVINFIKKYNITYPVAYNCEGFNNNLSRQYGLTNEQRSSFAEEFLNTVKSKGYTAMFYASKNELENNAQWNTSKLSGISKIWVAWYPDTPYPTTEKASYAGNHHMWQYTSNGIVKGISKPVDINVSYLGIAKATGETGGVSDEQVTISPEANMNFQSVNETVTAKIEVNLRDKPSQDTDSKVVLTLKNGQTATRTGISPSGWSRVVYNGVTYYAVSSYLTTDMSQPSTEPTTNPDIQETESAIKTQFTDVNETVTAKIEVNLRTLPSVTDAEVAAKLVNGEKAVRTGISEDTGWSRVEYNGQTLYCVSSYLEVAE